MKRISLIASALAIILHPSAIAGFTQGGPQPGDVYKEFAVSMHKKNWRVTDPNVDLTRHPAAANHLPNAVIDLEIDDLAGATKAEIIIDFWEGHDGTTGKQFRLNNKPWIDIPEPIGNKFFQQVNHLIPLPLSNLKEGTNKLEGICDRNGWNWGQWGWYGVIVRVYYDSSKPHATGQITSPASNASFGENPVVTASTSVDARRVDFIAYYEGYDKDGDGDYLGWQRDYHRASWDDPIGIRNHVGTDNTAPFSATWSTNWVPDQAPNLIKLIARVQNADGYWYVTPEVTGLNLNRPNSSVKLYKPYGVPERYWARASRKNQNSYVDISSLASFNSAIVQVATWNGDDGTNDFYSKVNGYTLPEFGADHFYSYDEVPVPKSSLQTGANKFTFFSSTTHHGIEIMWPGPAISVRYGTAAPPPPNPEPDPDPIPTGDPVLILGMEFEETDGATVFDSSSNANDGTLTGGIARDAAGHSGRSLRFSGSGGHVDLGALDIPGPGLTLACWFRADAFGTGSMDGRFLSKATGLQGDDHYWMLSTISSGGVKPRFRLKTTNGGTTTLIGTTSLQPGVWTHLAATYDGAAMRLYVNGVFAGSTAKSGQIVQAPTVPAAVGDQPQGGRNFDGLIDDLAIFVGALDQTAIAQLMDDGIPNPPDGDTEAPGPPTGLVVTLAADTTASLSWNASTDNFGVSSYNIYRNGAKVGSSTATTFSDESLGHSSNYVYTVTAVDEAGNESSPSNEATVETPPSSTPGPGSDVSPELLLGMGFEEAGGSTVFDSSPNANDGTLTSGVIRDAVGYSGKSLRFSGTGGRVDLGALDIPGTGLTLACWFRADDFGTGAMDGRFLSKATGVQGDDHYWMLSTISSGGVKPRFRLKTTSGGTTTLIGNTSLQPGVWTHLAATYDGASMRLYVNGVFAGSIAKTGQIVQAPSVSAAVGNQPQEGRNFDGLIDDLVIFVGALDLSEIAALMENGIVVNSSPSQPENLQASGLSLTQIGLTWNASSDDGLVIEYRIFRSGQQVGTSTTESFTDTDLEPGMTYQYQVQAVDNDLSVSALSSSVSGSTLPDTSPPSVPSGVQAVGQSTTSILVSWLESTDNYTVVVYRVSRDGTQIAEVAGTSFLDDDLAPNTSYNYSIEAIDFSGNPSGSSDTATGETLPDLVPGPDPNPNVLVNGEFETDLSSWKFYTNGSGNATVAAPGYGGSSKAVLVALNAIGSNVQFYQQGISLEPNAEYELTFATYSNSGHDLRVSLSKHGSPYTNYGLQRVFIDVTTGWQLFTVSFTTQNFTTPVIDARLSFWFATDASPGDWYFLDQIRLAEIN